jgi:RimJ/RimL family protein N-acetyltransferase
MLDETPGKTEGWRGGRPTVRLIEAADLEPLRRFFDGVSAESRYARFLGHIKDLSPAMWRYLTDIDGRDHVAYVACHGGPREIVGVGRWIRLANEPSTAEVALLIGDAHQRQGIGRALCGALIDAARERRVSRLRAFVLPDNRGIRRLLRGDGLRTVRDAGNVVDVELVEAARRSA